MRSTLLLFLALALSLSFGAGCTTPSGGTAPQQRTDAAKEAPRVLIVVTSHGKLGDTGKPTGYFLAEVVHPYHALREAGFVVEFASPAGGKPPVDPRSLKLDADPQLAAFWNNPALRGQLERSLKLSEVRPERYRAVVFAGGHGTMWDFPTHSDVARVGEAVYARGGVVAAVCHGPAALVGMKRADGAPLVKGRRVATFTDAEERAVKLDEAVPFLLESRLRALGAEVKTAPLWKPNVVVDGKLVTGQNPNSARGVGEAVARLLRAE